MIGRLKLCVEPLLTIAAMVIGILLPCVTTGCGNCGDSKTLLPKPCPTQQAVEPIFYSREAEGIYPHSVALLNGEPTYFIGIKHHFKREH